MVKLTLESDPRLCGAVLLINMIFQITLGFHGEIGTLGRMQRVSRLNLLVTMKVMLCSLGTTMFKGNFFVAIEASMPVTKA